MKKFTAQILPRETVDKLIDASIFGNIAQINRITDELADQGICRRRDDVSLFPRSKRK